ncbi:MAG: two-component system, OmpR family, sensor kinase [Frankiales bacterium]|nr:two-component system, OmpR family, sensor kinase [Frankiales bacterium]MDX6208489.1 two-component system, OmpR family, sensor kinase [Frankiales bacterium]
MTSAFPPTVGDDEALPRPRRFGRLRALSDRTPLRVKLVVSVLLLTTVGLLIAGTAASTMLRSYMTNRVDQQLLGPPGALTQVAGQQAGVVAGSRAGNLAALDCTPSEGISFRRPTSRYVQCTSLTGSVISPSTATTPTGTAVPALPHWTQAQVVAQAGRPFTVPSVGTGPRWRVRARVVGQYIIMDANSLDDVDSAVARLELYELVVGLTVLVLIAGLGYWVVRRSLRPLADVEHTAAAIADGDLTRRVPHRDPRTEVGRLALSVNGMLGQIETSFRIRRLSEEAALASEQRMRRFVTDASHELRTPLTSIRGFAELYRQGAAGSPDDVARLMRRIEDEAARMGLLVDDLLLLARLDQQRPLEREIVDLLTIAKDAVHDATVVAPDRAITLQVIAGPTPPEIIGDESRLRQVVGNLVTNALNHTPAGTPVTVRIGSRVESTGLFGLIEVSDTGPGLDAEASARVFERFYRADPSRTRSLGGTGLGLSIVAALVAAHGGRVELETAPGEGATFRVLLPAAPDPELIDVEPAYSEE